MADIRPRGDRKSVRFVDAFLSVITRAIYQPKRIDEQFRPATHPRRVHGRGASWRDIVGGVTWADPANRRAHKKWTAQTRKDRATLAAIDAHNHSIGATQSTHHKSARTLRRAAARASQLLGWL